MKCTLCGYEFKEAFAESACKGCVIKKGCTMAKCPNCGFEMPLEPNPFARAGKWRIGTSPHTQFTGWVSRWMKFFKRRKGKSER